MPQILPPPAKSKKGSYFRKLYKCEHEIARGTTSILKVGVRVGVFLERSVFFLIFGIIILIYNNSENSAVNGKII